MRKSPNEIINEMKKDFFELWGYEPPVECLIHECEKKIEHINKKMLILLRASDSTLDEERKVFYKSLHDDEGDNLGLYLTILDILKEGK